MACRIIHWRKNKNKLKLEERNKEEGRKKESAEKRLFN